MGYMVFQKGGYDKVGFTSKDLHNHISKTRHGKVKDGDAFAALAYLLSKVDSDPLFLGKFTLKDGRLDNLVWANGASVVDYECFGDVLTFDTTYKKNVYNKPLVIFSGTNHHGQTTIFGCALLSDERAKTFKWALKEFLKIMARKLPGGVMTDGDRAMREAILEYTVQIFEERWSEIISKYGLIENEWVQGIYNDKMKWATAYLREHLFGRIRTTSQCEGIHSLLKNYVDSKTSLLEFMHKFSEVLRHYRNNHLTTDFDTFYKFAVLTTCLKSFEKQAAELYTRNIFKLVKDKIEATSALNVTECPNSGNIVELFEACGLPCSHIFGVLKHRNAKCVPTSLILKRWTRDAKSDFICSIGEQDSANDIVVWAVTQNKSDTQARLSPTSALIGDPVVVKSKGLQERFQKAKRGEDIHIGSKSKKSVSKLTETPKIRANGKKGRQKTEEITLTQGTLKDKTNTPEIEVEEVPGAATTKKSGLLQYPMHHYPVVHPYQPYGGVLPIPFHPVPNGMAYFNQYPSTAGITSYPQLSHISPYSSGPSDWNIWARLLNDVINNKKS
ncbi:protein FAR1-RELATED SEQUENCE 5-like [Arachis ipaensis]|uniref:protein FAR1-RELATED SEQUENCE 5-like n=1 Tax=Arachis ipaensis TaxID=130454 RepID=UPI0007AF7BB3|nr:protein FAR1-RELATED SEQUENCE 5-like [Arachis ipaensis]